MKIVALAGGVGGAKLADGLSQVAPPENLTVIVNTGDDFEHFGLHISPDLDTVCYTLAGLANPSTGWGRNNESWRALEIMGMLGGPIWFQLGDLDLGLHLERTRRLNAGQTLSQITEHICQVFRIRPRVLPMSDDYMPTWVYTNEGELPFQEYFVHRRCQPRVKGFRFDGVDRARPAPEALDALEVSDLIVICPSNPWVSVDPILAVPGMRAALDNKPIVAVSPIIGGQAVKGPAAKMYSELGITPSALAVASHYGSLLSGFVLDIQDEEQAEDIQQSGVQALVTDTLMKTPYDRLRLAEEVVTFGLRLSMF